MPWSGSSYSRTNGFFTGATVWTQDASAGVNILDTRHDTHDQDLASGIDACLNKNGANSPTADIPFGGYKATNVGSATARTHWLTAGQAQDGAVIWGGTSGGSANAQTITLTPAITAYAAGQRFIFIAGNTNTGATTLNVNSVGAKNIRQYDNSVALVGGEIVANGIVDCIYDGTQFLLMSNAGGWITWSPSYGAGGSMTFSSVTTNYARYRRENKTLWFEVYATGTTGGTASNHLTFTLPVAPARIPNSFYVQVYDGSLAGDVAAGHGHASGSTTVLVFNYNNSNWGLGAGRDFYCRGAYEV